jgi:hypothetical protein
MDQLVDDQRSLRVIFVYRLFVGTAFRAGYARYFTPPSLALSVEPALALFANTSAQPAVNCNTRVLPGRTHDFDQKLLTGLTAGVDFGSKIARDLLDRDRSGQSLRLTAYDNEKVLNDGVELQLNCQNGNFNACGTSPERIRKPPASRPTSRCLLRMASLSSPDTTRYRSRSATDRVGRHLVSVLEEPG